MADNEASRTAVVVCEGRAVADGRLAVGSFSDPVAMDLLRPPERAMVERVRAGFAPEGLRGRLEYEMLCGTAEILAARTVAIDTRLRERNNPQLVILGAGLDARAWRMPELASTEVFEVDQPASQRDKRDRIGDREPLAHTLSFVPVDFDRDALDSALVAAGFDRNRPTTWIWEGVVPYLTEPEVERTLDALAELAAPGSRLIVSYPTPTSGAVMSRWAMRFFLAMTRPANSHGREPLRSTWTPIRMHELLSVRGFTVSGEEDQLSVARRLGIPTRRPRIAAAAQVVAADR